MIKEDELKKGDRIKFKYYSNIDPYPVCIGTVDHVYGIGYITALLGKSFFQIDVIIDEVLNNHWYKDLVGRKVRIRNDFDIEIL